MNSSQNLVAIATYHLASMTPRILAVDHHLGFSSFYVSLRISERERIDPRESIFLRVLERLFSFFSVDFSISFSLNEVTPWFLRFFVRNEKRRKIEIGKYTLNFSLLIYSRCLNVYSLCWNHNLKKGIIKLIVEHRFDVALI